MAKKIDKKKIIFIVEDDEVLLRTLYILFHNENCTVATATDGETAINMARRLTPDVILLDLLIPKIDGFGVLTALKSDQKLKNTPVVVLSNLGDSASVDKAKSMGADDYYIKSNIDLTNLLKKIKKLLT